MVIVVDQRVLGRQDHEGHAERRVGPGGEDPDDVVAALDRQVELGALGAADPVALHGLDPLGPVQAVEGVQQLVGVGGDAEEPLLEVALDHQVAAALAGAVGQDLLVGQDGLAARAPVDRGVLAVGQAGLQEAQEDDLVPAHVQRDRGCGSPGASRRPAPRRFRLDFSSSMRASVKIRGWMPVLMAAFSAGRPKLSKPMGLSTA